MIIVEDMPLAIILMLLSLFCLGSWPLYFNILERRGRLPQHTYLDYSVMNFIVGSVFALLLGQLGEETPNMPSFITQLQQDNWPAVALAMTGGFALCLGNILMQYSLAFCGISLTEVVSASLAVVGGTTINYFLDDGLNQAGMLFPGVGCFLVAVILGSLCHASNAADIDAKLNPYKWKLSLESQDEIYSDGDSSMSDLLVHKCEGNVKGGDHFVRSVQEQQGQKQYKAVSKESFELIEHQRAIKVKGSSVLLGLVLAFLTGTCYALFSPLFNLATNDQLHLLKPEVSHLSVYTAFFYFSTAFFMIAILVNIWLLYFPILGVPSSSLSNYFSDNKGRHFAIAAGVVCGLGNGFQFMGGQAAGYAAADAVQALPLVGTFWGVVLFGEYRNSSAKTYMLLAGMLTMFTAAVVFLVASSRERKV
ncbi:ureide permease 1 isoform X1 [Cryptomeria japonica]|uniref:ureide permease 1 isoform X1 n=2 Tax=Cryptomeria japonica TaxID=3369 RepID=UPI0025AC7342|nr:ureide permease 1 isoform X1 [Cryptomeria japonica]XP_057824388.1 ureide permease 1 isoform X1 [Cryptomeria japonica]XP_057824389.1 ureide permease 1 isoform X1 [Cryptomeria japonica]